MDGTLWDNVHNYATAWNIALNQQGYSTYVTRESLLKLMGKEVRKILNDLVPNVSINQQDLLFQRHKREPATGSYLKFQIFNVQLFPN